MRVAVMQPYFLPYIGYYQLMAAADVFVVYDNIQYTKKGWINRNRLLQNGTDVMFSLPLKRGSDYLEVCQRELAADFNRGKLLNSIRGAYQAAPFFSTVFPLLQRVVESPQSNLFEYLLNSLRQTAAHLKINSDILISSQIDIDHGLRGEDKVLALCQALGAKRYLNPIGGVELYSRERFAESGIELRFVQSRPLSTRNSPIISCPGCRFWMY